MPKFIENLWSVVAVWLLAILIITAVLIWLSVDRIVALLVAIFISYLGISNYLDSGYSYLTAQAGAQAAIDVMTMITVAAVAFVIIAFIMTLFYSYWNRTNPLELC